MTLGSMIGVREWTGLGRGAHTRYIAQRLSACRSEDFGIHDFSIGFFLQVESQMGGMPNDRRRFSNYLNKKENVSYCTIYIWRDEALMSNESFQKFLSELLLDASKRYSCYLKKKCKDFDALKFENSMQQIFHDYMSYSFVESFTENELKLIKFQTGIGCGC